MMKSEELFRSANLIVRAVSAEDVSRWVVTFDNYGLVRPLDRAGFGEAYLRGECISAVHVVSRGNDWYQYDETPAALEVIRRHVAGAERIITYGSSMGAYAAIRFADRVGATAALALSPQYSIDPAKAPFERRWPQEATLIHWNPELDGPIRCACCPIIFYDSRDVDALHVKLIAADTRIIAVSLPFTAHPSTTFLADVGALSQIVPALAAGTLDVDAVSQDLLARRRTSAVYLSELARRQPAVRPRWAIALARRAATVSPESPLMLHILAKRLSEAGEHEEALALYERVLEVSERYIGFLMPYSQALLAAGQADRALAIAKEMIAADAGQAQLQGWLGHVLWSMGRRREARRAMMIAARNDPMNRHYHYTLRRYAAETPVSPAAARALVLFYDLRVIGLRARRLLLRRVNQAAGRYRRHRPVR